MVISRSPVVLSDFFEKDIPQVIQGFPQLQGIHQGLAAPILAVQPDQAFTPDQKRGHTFVIDPDPGQVPAIAQEKRPTEDVRDLKDMLVHLVHLLPPARSGIDFFGEIR
jgi:hypothetical protein